MVKKRGASFGASRLNIGFGHYDDAAEKQLEPRRRSMKWLKIVALVAFAAVIVAWGGYAYFQFKERQEQERKENLVWKAMYELSVVEGDKTVNYLRLHDTHYENGQLKMDFLVHNPGFRPFLLKDSMIRAMFHSVVALNKEHWATAASYLEEAGVDTELTFIYRDTAPTMIISHRQLAKVIANEELMEAAMADFVLFKTKEVLGYAKQNYKGDSYITPDSTTLTRDYVTLYLSFDDSKYYLDKSLLDTTRVGVHFTDRVGDMGSILDGMLSICSRTDRGFAFVYKGTKKNTTHRLEWNRERTRKILSEYSKRIWHKDAETNRVKSYVVRERKGE